MSVLGRFGEPLIKFRFARQDKSLPAKTGNGGHLRVVLRADNHHRTVPAVRVGYNRMDLCHVWAGGVVDHTAGPRLQSLNSNPAFPMGANDYGTPVRHFLRTVNAFHPQLGQTSDNVVVMDDGTQHIGALVVALRCLLRDFHSALYSVTEAGCFRKNDIHAATCSPRARMRCIRSSAMAWYSSGEALLPATSGV
ncbi:hypothetical protein SDC9_60789 [bioreactor metagenome]|uniref:Uncharacterized protein n=1 Tax=bioreactor metagenome TaxID=1076179 RepID=A0A644XET3_9ZZZZ